jgi:hypothetical protein
VTDVSKAVLELTRNVREITGIIAAASPRLTEADRTALRALLDDLAALVTSTRQLK